MSAARQYIGKIIDGDGHIIERDTDLFEFLDPPYRGNTTMLGFPFFPTLDGFHRGAIMARNDIFKSYEITPQRWMTFLDEVGIVNTVLYPTAGLAFGVIQDPEWAVALARAYNNWFTERFFKHNNRLRGVALIPLQDVGEAVKEMRRAISELGMVGVVLPGNNADMGVRKLLGDPSFWPIYEEAERLDCGIAIHGAVSMNIGLAAMRGFAGTQALEHPFAQMAQMTSMMFEGVFEKFPKLRVAFLEAGTSWVPFMMDRLDRSYEAWASKARREFSPLVKKVPSEYMNSGNLFYSCEGAEYSMKHAIERIGSQQIMFASDFPHETNVERARHEIEELAERTDVADVDKHNILSGVAVQRFYRR